MKGYENTQIKPFYYKQHNNNHLTINQKMALIWHIQCDKQN